MKKILFIDNYKIFKNWASKTYEYKINEIRKDEKFHYFDIDDDINNINIKNYDTVIFGWNMTYISKYYTLKRDFYLKYVKDLETDIQIKNFILPFMDIKNKYLIIQDFNCNHDYLNGLNGLTKFLIDNKINNIITPYLKNNGIEKIKKNIKNINIIHMQHHINSNYFKNWKLEKKYDIFIFGNISKKFYPFRWRLYNLLKKYQDDLNILFWEGIRNYFKFKKNISNENLSKCINKSWITICTSSKFKLVLGKYMETSMSGSVICGDLPEDGKDTWKGNMIEINENMTDDQIINIISKYLDDKNELNKIINNCIKKTEKFYLKNFSKKLYQKITEKVNS
jgi:hypothetical protein